MGVYYCIWLIFTILSDYLPFFDSMFGVKRAKKCISDLLASQSIIISVYVYTSEVGIKQIEYIIYNLQSRFTRLLALLPSF